VTFVHSPKHWVRPVKVLLKFWRRTLVHDQFTHCTKSVAMGYDYLDRRNNGYS
jgi:hypothetical protein